MRTAMSASRRSRSSWRLESTSSTSISGWLVPKVGQHRRQDLDADNVAEQSGFLFMPMSPPAPDADPDDWLTVNVFTPDLGAAGLPVMVWIYGGAYHSARQACSATTVRRWPGRT